MREGWTKAWAAITSSDLEKSTQAMRMRRVLQIAPFVGGGLACFLGATALVGWWSGVPALTLDLAGLPPMAANSGLMAVLLGASLMLAALAAAPPGSAARSRAPAWATGARVVIGKVCAGVAGVIAALTLVEYVLEIELGLDRVLADPGGSLAQARYPGRPSLLSAATFLFTAMALLIHDPPLEHRRRLVELLGLASGLVAVLAALGYLFGVPELYGSLSGPASPGMGVPTVFALLALDIGIVARGADRGVLSILTKEDSGGTTARQLAAWLIALAPVMCAIAIGARLRLYTLPFASTLVILIGIVARSVLVLRASWRLSRLDARRRDAEELLRQAHEHIELALRGADLASWDWNIESGDVTFNARWAELRGYVHREIDRHVDSWFSGIHPDDLARVQDLMHDHLQGHSAEYESEHRVRTKSGEWIWILDRGKVFARNAAGQPVRMVGIELDISARKRLEVELRVSEAKSTGILSISADAIVSIDEEQRITMFNEGAEKLFGCSKAEAIGAPLDLLIPERFRAVHREHVARFMAGPGTARRGGLSIACLRKGGEEFPADAAISKLTVAGHQVLTVALRDVSERIRGEEERARLYAEAQRAVQVRDDIVGIVAHDLRSPLGVILMQAEALRMQGEVLREPGELNRAVERIERSVIRMNRLVDDLLEVTRIEAGRLPVERGPLAVDELVAEIIEIQRPLAAAVALELREELAPDLPAAWADRHRLQQVFENLVGNALKFTTRGGAIVVGAAPRDGELLFWVADTGSGISSEELPHVFERFWQARRPGRRGAGLGLPIVKGIVEAHEGRIWVESTPGHGSTFFFTIPAAGRASLPQPARSAS
jgi:PAS domain S-box-containing protein